MQSNINDKVVILGNVRIRAKSIKNYGVASGKRYYEKIYEMKERKGKILWMKYTESVLEWEGDSIRIDEGRYKDILKPSALESKNGQISQITIGQLAGVEHKTTYRRYRDDNGELVDSNEQTTMDDIIEKKEKYLYITTYQKDNFIFYQNDVDFDIHKKCNEIDMIFG